MGHEWWTGTLEVLTTILVIIRKLWRFTGKLPAVVALSSLNQQKIRDFPKTRLENSKNLLKMFSLPCLSRFCSSLPWPCQEILHAMLVKFLANLAKCSKYQVFHASCQACHVFPSKSTMIFYTKGIIIGAKRELWCYRSDWQKSSCQRLYTKKI